MLGSTETLRWSRTDAALEIARSRRAASEHAIVFKILTAPAAG